MSIPIQNHTRNALGNGLLPQCSSRSLFAARFADPASRENDRKQWFNAFIAKPASPIFPSSNWLPENASVIHARLMSRLLVDLAGGVMENANLNLDRYGLPRIPGSAVKGCARRMALQALHDWITFPDTPDDPTVPCRNGFSSPAEMLAAVARIFGWQEQDWSDHRSDFFWAVGRNAEILNSAIALLPPSKDFAGSIAFLSASPNKDPGLELDVVTPHHTAYYTGNNPGAPDTEDPVPVYFPAVKPQANNNHFIFPLIPLARAQQGDITAAMKFLSHGLELLGVGAKTHAGYGWFERDRTADDERRNQIQTANDAKAVETMQPNAVIQQQFQEWHSKNQLQAKLNSFSYEMKFWTNEATLEYKFTLFDFVKTSANNLAESKNGLKAMQNLAANLKLPFP